MGGAYSPHTLYAYKKDLNFFNQFLKQNRDLVFFYEYMDKRGLNPRSKARVLSSVKSYLKFLEKKGKKTQTSKLHSVKIRPSLPKLISHREFQKIHKAACVKNKPSATARNHTTLLLLFGLGCRISEIINIRLQDVKEMERSIVITGKRNKQRLLPLPPTLFKNLKEYIYHHRPLLVKNNTFHFLLVNNRGRQPSRVDVWRWLSTWSKKAGFCEVKSPHQFRHGFATSLLENGADLRSIQLLLGHSSIQTTQIYTSVKKTHLQNVIKKHHPLSYKKSLKPSSS